MFRDLDTLHKLIREYCQGKDEEVKTVKKDQAASPSKEEAKANLDESNEVAEDEQPNNNNKKKSPKKASSIFKIKHNTFIIQKYIEEPLLIYNRKFDI